MLRVLILTSAVVLAILVAAGSAVGIAYWVMARRFVAGDAHAIDGIVRAPCWNRWCSATCLCGMVAVARPTWPCRQHQLSAGGL